MGHAADDVVDVLELAEQLQVQLRRLERLLPTALQAVVVRLTETNLLVAHASLVLKQLPRHVL
jgi:hypothetical protein